MANLWMVFVLGLPFVVVGCTSDGSSEVTPSDAATGDDHPSGGAGAGDECAVIGAEMVELLQQHATCVEDEDCTTVLVGGCFSQYVPEKAGLAPLICGDQPANVSILVTEIDDLTQALFDCLGACVTCGLGASGARCENGACVGLP